ncbi:MAG: tetratricopeptide repeat protein, partial [Verrucomicrobiales bacterium]|nr:tetratricopeptide repeat protein [Verrucomicrobiales bacterium]
MSVPIAEQRYPRGDMLTAETIFLNARELRDPVARETYLTTSCGDDLPLRASVLALLAAAEQADAYFGEDDGMLPPPPEALLDPEGSGSVIGRYLIEARIGEGGMGVVYRARQTSPLVRLVALKVIKLGMDTRRVVARFEAERQALALMDHPHIARVLDAGSTDSGRPYFVMELVSGMRLTDHCDQLRLPLPHRLRLFIQVCHAVQHAHQKGIVHRDLKPSNILVAPSQNPAEPGTPRIIDFGIAKAVQATHPFEVTLTTQAGFLGTPSYMSPEQAAGDADIDTRTDIYSLGVLLYELLTGRTPFDASPRSGNGLRALESVLKDREPPRPSTRVSQLTPPEAAAIAAARSSVPARLVEGIRGDLDWIILKCLEKDRARRYPGASALAADLERHLAFEPVSARPPSARYRLRKMIRRHRLAVLAGGLVGLSLLAGLAVAGWQYRETRLAYARAHRDATLSQQVATFLEQMLEAAGPAVARGRDTQMLREIVDTTAERVGRELADQPEVEARIRASLSKVYYDMGEYTKAEAMDREALRLYTSVLPPDDLRLQSVKNNLAGDLHQLGRLDECEVLLRECLEARRRLKEGDSNDMIIAMFNLASLQMFLGMLPEADAGLQEARAMAERMASPEPGLVAGLVDRSGSVLSLQSRHEEALGMFQRALELRRGARGLDHPEYAESLHNLGVAFLHLDRLDEAERTLSEALALKRRILGPLHPGSGATLANYARVVAQRGRLDEAETAYRESLRIQLEALGPAHAQVREAFDGLTSTLLRRGALPEAEALHLQYASGTNSSQAMQLPAADRHRLRGLLLAQAAQPAEAVRELETALALDPHQAQAVAALGILFAAHPTPMASSPWIIRARQCSPTNATPAAARSLTLAFLVQPGGTATSDPSVADWLRAGTESGYAPVLGVLRAAHALRRGELQTASEQGTRWPAMLGEDPAYAAFSHLVAARAQFELGR